MFSEALRLYHSPLKAFQSVFFKTRRGFTASTKNPRTLQGLEEIYRNPKSYQKKTSIQDLIILDKLNETSHSATFRAFNKETKSFVAHQTIIVEDPLSFAQIELILDQYNLNPQRPHFSDILSVQYDKTKKEVQVLTELEKATLQDITSYIATNPSHLTDEMLSEYAWQLLDFIVNPTTTTFDSLQLQNLYVNIKENSIKAHDFLDFAISRASLVKSKKNSMEIISTTIKKIANIGDQEVLQTKFPKTFESLEEMKEIAQAWDKEQTEKATMELKARMQNRPSITPMVSENYNNFIVEKLLMVLKAQNSSQLGENIDLIKKALIKPNRQIYIDHLQVLKKAEEDQLNKAKDYKSSAQYELSSKFYSEAFQTRLKIEKIEKLLEKCENGTHYKSPIVEYLDSLPSFVTKFIFPILSLGFVMLFGYFYLKRNKESWLYEEDWPPTTYSQSTEKETGDKSEVKFKFPLKTNYLLR